MMRRSPDSSDSSANEVSASSFMAVQALQYGAQRQAGQSGSAVGPPGPWTVGPRPRLWPAIGPLSGRARELLGLGEIPNVLTTELENELEEGIEVRLPHTDLVHPRDHFVLTV